MFLGTLKWRSQSTQNCEISQAISFLQGRLNGFKHGKVMQSPSSVVNLRQGNCAEFPATTFESGKGPTYSKG